MVPSHSIRAVGGPAWFDVQDTRTHAAVAVRVHVTTKSNHQEYRRGLPIRGDNHDVNGGEDEEEDGVVLKTKAEAEGTRFPAVVTTRRFDTSEAVLRK